MISPWTFEALPPALLAEARAGRLPHRRLIAADPRLPCRCCLAEAVIGADVLLVSVDPFATASIYAQPGPVFVCAACARRADTADPPEIVSSRNVGLRAFDRDETMLYPHSAIVAGSGISEALSVIFSDRAVDKVHVHTALHGCYLCRAVRA
jgi:hypothetical protein